MTSSYWLERPYTPRPPLSQHLIADAVVIGAGMTGVAQAWFLHRAGMRVLLIEAHTVAGGATGRNAGFVTSGLGEHYSRSVEFWGRKDAAAISKLHRGNHEIVATLIEEHGFECDYRQTGSLAVAVDSKEEAVLRSSHALLREDNFTHELWEAEEVDRILSGRGFRCGLFNPSDACVDPVKLVRGFAGVAEAHGMRIFENSPIESLRRTDGGWVLHSPSGSAAAPLLFLACNAWVPLLSPGIPLQPVRGQCLAISGLCISLPEIPCLTNYGSEYWRGVAGGAIFGGMRRFERGGESGYGNQTTEAVQVALRDFCHRHFPELAHTNVTHRWSGIMAYSTDGLPLVGPVPGSEGMYVSAGYTGHGFGYAFLAARWLARLAAEGIDEVHRLCRIGREMRPSPALTEL